MSTFLTLLIVGIILTTVAQIIFYNDDKKEIMSETMAKFDKMKRFK